MTLYLLLMAWIVGLAQAGSLSSKEPPLPAGAVVRLGSAHLNLGPSAVFSPNGKILAALTFDRSVGFWDVATGKEIAQLSGKHINQFVFAPDGKSLYVLDDGHIRQVDAVTHKELRRFSALGFSHLAVSPNGKWLATSNNHKALLWDTVSGKAVRLILFPEDRVGRNGIVTPAVFIFSPDSKLLARVYPPELEIVEVATGKMIRDIPLPGEDERKEKEDAIPHLVDAAFAPDSRTLACLSSQGHVFLTDVVSGKQLRRFTTWNGDSDGRLAFSPDGKHVAVGSWAAPEVHLYDLTTAKKRTLLAPNRGTTYHRLFFSPDGRYLADAGDGSGCFQLWDRIFSNRLHPQLLRTLRAVDVLERIGSNDAQALLKILATGAEGTQVTQQARAALARWKNALPASFWM